jgi:hypothetical protein
MSLGPDPAARSRPVTVRCRTDRMAGWENAMENAASSGSAAFVQFISDSFPMRQLTAREYRQESDLLICENVYA